MAKAFDTLKAYYTDRIRGVQEWKKKGGQVLGYTCHLAPMELAHAAGLMPWRIVGDNKVDATTIDKYFEDISSPWVRNVYQLQLDHKYDFLNGWVMAASSDSIIRMHYTFDDNPHTAPVNEYWIDIPRQPNIRNFRYNLCEYELFRDWLQENYHVNITDSAIRESIKVFNENRKLLQKVAELRRANPCKISGLEAQIIIGAGFWMPKEQHNALLKQLIDEVGQSSAKHDGIRIFLSGSPQHNQDFYNIIENAGCVVVAEDCDTGNRIFEGLVSEEPGLAPLEALADKTIWHYPTPRIYPMYGWHNYFESKVMEANVAGTIFYFLKWEDLYGFHCPELVKRLDKHGIPSIMFEMQEYSLGAPERLRIRLDAFVELAKERAGQKV